MRLVCAAQRLWILPAACTCPVPLRLNIVLCEQEAGIQPEARHANPLVFAEAVNVSVHTAISGPMKEMQEGRLGIGCRPNADTYNAITQVGHCQPSPLC